MYIVENVQSAAIRNRVERRNGSDMKIEIERFGPMKKFQYDLSKDLIVTYGNNNIGKSYSMQIVYLLLKTFRNQAELSGVQISTELETLKDQIKSDVTGFISSDLITKDITDVFSEYFFKAFTQIFMHEFLHSCQNTFGNFDQALEKHPVIHIVFHDFCFSILLKEKRVEGSSEQKTVRLVKTESGFHKSLDKKDVFRIYVREDEEQPVRSMMQLLSESFARWSQWIKEEFHQLSFLPASRSGIYSGMNAFGPIVAELSKNRAYITRKIEFPGISEPISDYFITLSNIKSKQNEQYKEYYTKIENEILKGKVTFDNDKNALMYQPDKVEAQFEMSEVSSMVSEISPIVAFLKYTLASQLEHGESGKSILFIEEPEAHLHPINQIALVQVFSELINADIKLVISSHSNYVFHKLNNLVLAKQLDFHAYQPIVLEDLKDGSVSKALQIDELGASDENFVDVSEALYYEREKIIQEINREDSQCDPSDKNES